MDSHFPMRSWRGSPQRVGLTLGKIDAATSCRVCSDSRSKDVSADGRDSWCPIARLNSRRRWRRSRSSWTRYGVRLAALEAARPVAASAGVKRGRRAEAAEATGEGRRKAAEPALGLVSAALSFGGRTLLVLAGAFVLRAMTDSKAMPDWLGVALGLVYAAIWIGLADRAARAGQSLNAGVHGFAAIIIAYPLLFEAAGRFKLLGPSSAAAALALVTTGLLAVAARRRMQPLAWMATVGSILTTYCWYLHFISRFL